MYIFGKYELFLANNHRDTSIELGERYLCLQLMLEDKKNIVYNMMRQGTNGHK
jgi:hypothetical protein